MECSGDDSYNFGSSGIDSFSSSARDFKGDRSIDTCTCTCIGELSIYICTKWLPAILNH